MFECSRQPIGVSNIMAIDEINETYNHGVLLDAAIDSPIDLLLRADNCTSIARLRHLINQSGLHERSELFRLNEEQHEDLLAIESYINWTNNIKVILISPRGHILTLTIILATISTLRIPPSTTSERLPHP
jgi:hypothetical protein